MQLLDHIISPEALKKLPVDSLNPLCTEIRNYLISTILSNGGHFAGNLGVVELSVALHYVFHSPNDKFIWDVGHQSYVHKILTGRKDQIDGIRHFGGISGFPKMDESEHDIFGTGHSSTAISAACGIAEGQRLKGQSDKVIAIVGDGALTGGMSFEALNNIMLTQANLLIVINDNHIGIDPNNGAVDKHLQNITQSKNNIFTNLGIPYSGPFDGHDIEQLISVFSNSRNRTGPEVIHLRTLKGKGYEPAENEQTKWHSTSKYVKIETAGKPGNKKWQDAFADILNDLAERHENVVGITPAMPSGSGMIRNMNAFPDRFFDVGIAEQHAVTFAAGLAVAGFVPYVNIYSSFLQRGYDQLIHDVVLQKLPVVFCVDRAGLVGEDGPTHHGAFDIAFLKPIPGIAICAPRNEIEFRHFLNMAYDYGKPIAIRYPKGELPDPDYSSEKLISDQPICLKKGNRIALICTGIASEFALQAAQKHDGAAVFHFPVIKPLNTQAVKEILEQFSHVITVEDGCISGGFGESINTIALHVKPGIIMENLGIPDHFVTHGDNKILYELCNYGPNAIAEKLAHLLA